MKRLLYFVLAGMLTLPLFGEESRERISSPYCALDYSAESDGGIGRGNKKTISFHEDEGAEARERKPRLKDLFEVVDSLFVEGPFRNYNGRIANSIYALNEAMKGLQERLEDLGHVRIDMPKGLGLPDINFGEEARLEKKSTDDERQGNSEHKLRINLRLRAEEDNIFCGWEGKF